MSVNGIAVTPEGRVSYPNLFKAKHNSLNGKSEFSVELLFKKGENLKKLEALFDEAMTKKFGEDKKKWPNKSAKFRSPFYKQDELIEKLEEKGQSTAHLEKGAIFVRLKTENQPGVVDGAKQEILSPAEVYGGCYGKASVRAFAYSNAGNVGVSFTLNNFQKTRDGDSFGVSRTTAVDDFEEVDSDNSDLVG